MLSIMAIAALLAFGSSASSQPGLAHEPASHVEARPHRAAGPVSTGLASPEVVPTRIPDARR